MSQQHRVFTNEEVRKKITYLEEFAPALAKIVRDLIFERLERPRFLAVNVANLKLGDIQIFAEKQVLSHTITIQNIEIEGQDFSNL